MLEKAEKPCSILIVDDNEPSRLLIAHVISQELKSAEMTLAGTGEQALQLMNKNVYDVILLDLLMPEMGGFEVLKRIRADSMNKSTPVVIVSVRGTTTLFHDESVPVERAESLGANAVIFKPFTRQELVFAVKAQLGMR